MSKQHIVPNRLKRIFPRTEYYTGGFQFKFEQVAERFAIRPQVIKRNGGWGSRSLRIVCKTCNEGWLNLIEQEAFTVLEPLMRGESPTLAEIDCQLVAAFCATLFTMIDRDEPRSIGITKEERAFIFQHHRPPENWTILIGRHTGASWHRRFRHHGFILGESKAPVVRPEQGNTQVCTFGAGPLFLHCVSTNPFRYIAKPDVYAAQAGMGLIFPFNGAVDFSALPILADSHIDQWADIHFLWGIDMLAPPP